MVAAGREAGIGWRLRACGDDVRFVCGSDDNGVSTLISAGREGKSVEELTGGTQNTLVRFARGGRGYVLRRIIRRAVRHGYKLGVHDPLFYRLVAPLEREMGAAYPELGAQRAHIERVLKQEEDRFAETLDQGMGMLENAIGKLHGEVIPGKVVFKLYDTYGFPLDLTADIARERGLSVDESGFSKAMEAQRERGRAASVFGANESMALAASLQADGVEIPETEFTGYDQASAEARVGLIVVDGKPAASAAEGDQATVFLDRTPFYAESGGQIGDTGTIAAGDHSFTVVDTQKNGKAIVHYGSVQAGEIGVGDNVTLWAFQGDLAYQFTELVQ